MDKQVVELLGRNHLTNELLRAGLEVARPVRDRGIDVIAYADLEPELGAFVARPIQMKAASARNFRVDKKYAKFQNLLIAYVWHLDVEGQVETYALDYEEALAVADEMGWTRTATWRRATTAAQDHHDDC